MADAAGPTCFHCTLPAGSHPLRYRMAGARQPFCCHGCYLVCLMTGRHGEQGESLLALARLTVGVTCGMVVMIFSWSHYADRYLLHDAAGDADALALLVRYYVLLTATVAVAVLGVPILRDALAGLRSLRAGIALLVAIGAFSAYGVSAVEVMRGGETYFDTATMILVFFTMGHYLEARGRARATDAMRSLAAVAPAAARVLRGGREIRVAVADLAIGDMVLVRAGETIPVDGVACEGGGGLNEAALTGESRPVAREIGDRLLAGSVSLDGAFVIRVTALAADRTVARLARLAEEAKRQRPAWVGLADTVASIFTPAVILLAIAAFAFWAHRLGFIHGLLVAMSVLLIACPCTLGVATPLAFWSGLALAARRGILVRSGPVFERLARASDVFFDKTGTLTDGLFTIVDVLHGDEDGPAAAAAAPPPLQIAASLESRAQHPVASALRAHAAAAGLAELPLSDGRVHAGLGVRGRIAGGDTEYVLGSRRLMERCGLEIGRRLDRAAAARSARGESVAYLGWEGRVRAAFVAAEAPRAEARTAVEELRRLGSRVALLSGDQPASAGRLGAAVGVSDIRSALLPHEKVDAVQAGRRAVMVGDGINDAAALAAAHVGIALGCGTDIAREMADVTMIGSNLMQVPWLLRFARRIRRTVVTNLLWAFAYNVVGIGLALAGSISPVLAALAMVASSLFVFANTGRLARADARF
ncbi:MAG: heavy metal translocating P-type ATPase [Acidobacteria bacterium]|nr:heavy metal translocating P-type ATPase [Acidobacteriota bacterium]